MNGLLRRLKRRRAATADEPPPGTSAASEPVDATVVSLEEGAPLSEDDRDVYERLEELRKRRRDLPAGVDFEQLDSPVGEGGRRSALRRRVRFLRHSREILLRDLGGFYFELHRSGGAQHSGHRDILERKAGRLAAIDDELRQLEARLGETSAAETVLREPGIGGICPACGELHGSDAGWCWHCGTPLTERARDRAKEEVEREIAARKAREAEKAKAATGGADPATSELAARVREATASGETTRAGSGAAPRDAAGGGDAETRELAAPDADPSPGDPSGGGANGRATGDDAVTQGERRR